MRELDECTAEVFRRGEKRLKERRRSRNRVLAVCIPIFLIAAVWSAVRFPAGIPETAGSDQAPPAEEMAGSAPQCPACPYTAVEIQPDGLYPEEHDGKVTDRLAVAEIFEAVNSLFADADGNGQAAAENLPSDENQSTDDGSAKDCQTESASTNGSKGCTITFTSEDGSQAVYHLSGNMLVNGNTNGTVFLSDSQTAELMAVLGISE